MNRMVGGLGAFVAGIILALIGVLGGVNALTGGTNDPVLSDQVVFYDAP